MKKVYRNTTGTVSSDMVARSGRPPIFTASTEHRRKALYEPVKSTKPAPMPKRVRLCRKVNRAETRMVPKVMKARVWPEMPAVLPSTLGMKMMASNTSSTCMKAREIAICKGGDWCTSYLSESRIMRNHFRRCNAGFSRYGLFRYAPEQMPSKDADARASNTSEA